MAVVAFVTGISASAALLVLSLAGFLKSGFRFWPPPYRNSWQYTAFWALFRIFVVALIVVCIADFHHNGKPPLLQSVLGWSLVVSGFGLAFLITGRLGWDNAHGEAVELKTDGWFALSRNPIYVVSILGMTGLALAINSTLAGVLLMLWVLMYVLAPYSEEPWLEKQYGRAYRDYCRSVPRFIGRVRNA